MKSIFFRLCGLALITCSSIASALTPAPGLWWNPNEGGRGYTIDVQGNVMIVTAYVYSQGGAATWFLASGQYDENANVFSATLGAYSGGQCFGCAFSSAHPVAAGTVSIHFTSAETGTMTFPGGSTQIQHEIYAYQNKNEYLYGEWAFNMDIAGTIDAQWVVFNTTFTGSDGTHYIAGAEDGVTGTAALGLYSTNPQGFIVIVGDIAGYTHSYAMPIFDDRRMLGLGVLEPPGVTPSSFPNVSAGSRILFRNEVAAKKLAAPDPALLLQLEEKMKVARDTMQ